MKTIDLSIAERVELLTKLDWATSLTESEFEKLARYVLVYSVEKDERIFNEGEDGCYLALISSGRIRVVKEGSSHSPRKIAMIEEGEILGEMALIDGQPRSASAYAQEDSRLLLLTADNFGKLRAELSLLGMKILTSIARAMSRRLRLTNDWLIDALNHSYEGIVEVPPGTKEEDVAVPPPPGGADIVPPGFGNVSKAQPPATVERLAREVDDLRMRVAALETAQGGLDK